MTSFNQLKQDLIDLTENNSSGFSTESNQFIDTAERRLARDLDNVPELYKHQNATLTIGDAGDNDRLMTNDYIDLKDHPE